jgi:hypothetical protein
MPPTFFYFLALTIWVPIACIVWLVAGLMFLAQRTRPLSRPLCFAMGGTFPFVFVYQIIAAPFVAGLLFAVWAFAKILGPGASTTSNSPLVDVVFAGGAFLALSLVLGMSLAGFYEGWRVGWACGTGRRFLEVMWEGPAARRLRRLLPRALARFTYSNRRAGSGGGG